LVPSFPARVVVGVVVVLGLISIIFYCVQRLLLLLLLLRLRLLSQLSIALSLTSPIKNLSFPHNFHCPKWRIFLFLSSLKDFQNKHTPALSFPPSRPPSKNIFTFFPL